MSVELQNSLASRGLRRAAPWLPAASFFGPWATALETGSSARLSTFWRRRMALLNEARKAALGTTRYGMAVLAIAACATLAMPTLYLSHAPAAVAAPDTARDEEGSARQLGRPVRVALPGGGLLEFVALGEHPSQGRPWWGPDGGLAEPPYQGFESEAHTDLGIAREFAVRWVKRPDEGVTAHWGVSGDTTGCAGGLAYDADGKPIENVEASAVTFRGEPRTCSVAIAVAAGPWKSLAETNGRNVAAEKSARGAFAFSRAIETKDGLVLTVSHSVLRDDVRLIAIDNQGKAIAVAVCEGGGCTNFAQTTGLFSDLALADIASFEVQFRPYEQYEIRDLSLWPGETTTPKLVKLDSQRQAEIDEAEALFRQRMELLDKVDGDDLQ
jgi:hypothetical protein